MPALRLALAMLGAGTSLAGVRAADAAPPASVVEQDALLRAAGNRKDVAERIGRSLFVSMWPAQVVKVHVEGIGPHEVAGLVISGVKFHAGLDPARFTDEVIALVGRAFAASDVEEVDVWATVPLPVPPNQVVDGDGALPTTRNVYAATVRRSETSTFAQRLHVGAGVFWDPAWRAGLHGSAGARQGVPGGEDQSK